jgi:Fe-S oxidoreductase
VPAVLEAGPIGLEGFDDRLVAAERRKGMHPKGLRLLPDGGGWLLIEMGSDTPAEAAALAARAERALAGAAGFRAALLAEDPEDQAELWRVRESALGATARVPGLPDAWEGWEDSAVAPGALGGYLRDLRKLYQRYGYEPPLYGHFGDGCLHTRTTSTSRAQPGSRPSARSSSRRRSWSSPTAARSPASTATARREGSCCRSMFGPELCAPSAEVKAIWDPENRMNPGKLVEPYPLDSNLRWARPTARGSRRPASASSMTTALLPGRAALRRRRQVPATQWGHDVPELPGDPRGAHSTRGRARLLFEMLRGETIAGGWRSEEVREALDLCLACKACKSECPVQVDMATYKAEFLHHHYRWRLRPRAAYALGLVHWWVRAASKAPRLANAVARNRWTGGLLKALGGIAPERRLPAVAPRTFRKWFETERGRTRRGPAAHRPVCREGEARRVVLFPDTFNNHFRPETARAAVEVLEATGFEVAIPPQVLCCGRPLYDFGLLGLAERQLRNVLDALRGEIRAGVPVVGLEPSCVATFRDELPNLLPNDQDARRLSAQTFTLAELLRDRLAAGDGFELPRLERRALVQAHCHHRSVLGVDADRALLAGLGLDHRYLDAGCCGMAGAFGYERGEKYRVSMACAESALLPEVRRADEDTLIVADGFSCRSQIEGATGRPTLHLAELLRLGWSRGPGEPEPP